VKELLSIPAALVCVFGCFGCVPFTVYDSPDVRGLVQDAKTQTPVARAQVRVETLASPAISATALSDRGGRFDVPAKTHRIWLPPLPFDLVYPDGIVTVSADGYIAIQSRLSDLLKGNGYSGTVVIQLDSK
jgi:hypothetical protein